MSLTTEMLQTHHRTAQATEGGRDLWILLRAGAATGGFPGPTRWVFDAYFSILHFISFSSDKSKTTPSHLLALMIFESGFQD